MKSVTIYKPNQETFFCEGGKIVKEEKETEIEVESILAEDDKVTVALSNKEELTFKGFPYSLSEMPDNKSHQKDNN